MSQPIPTTAPSSAAASQKLLRALAAATFVVFFQAYMVAPLIPRLATLFSVEAQTAGLAVPAYLIPYGVATLFYGLLADRLGPPRILLGSLLAFVALTALTATASSAGALVGWRLVTGLGASGVVPMALVLVSKRFAYAERGRALGWLFGAMAGGSAFGSTLGVLLEPYVGWRALFLGVAAAGAAVWVVVRKSLAPQPGAAGPATSPPAPWRAVLAGYGQLLGSASGARTYGYVLLNSVFHGGVFTWLALYFQQRFRLGEIGIGLALIVYGLPGFLLGPFIGRLADRWGRRWLVPAGLALSAMATLLLGANLPLTAAVLVVTVLSLGYDLTQPLLAAIVTDVGKERPGQAMGLNVFALFVGFGLGSWLFGEVLRSSLPTALLAFTGFEAVLALGAVRFFKGETREPAPS
ncbi:MFS transporter [Hymenobacter psychrotolerans]|uniref:Predicted arabinose efflux permease, MFS family n=1 Tax=Hymenobacter psychrotolerans DSM 18569 TaxID=1121959 RepID=A0A1M7GZU4_9BACT|nr:MFS transporter [Hymenobacter psychrotolerans]SHM21586.1 Predicted arabinose efflux permease, MFS family [Hymenobacter psychrotolerans DSM 18569]